MFVCPHASVWNPKSKDVRATGFGDAREGTYVFIRTYIFIDGDDLVYDVVYVCFD